MDAIWRDIVLYPVPIDRIAEVQALLARKGSVASDASGPGELNDDTVMDIITHQAAAG
jgi:hypothetical protein